MLLSIIIPVYNVNFSTLSKCLDSIFCQNTTDIEVVVIDNGPYKSNADILIRKKYGKVKLLKNRGNFGSAYSRNQGIDASSGKYIMFLDSDAYLKEDFFEKLWLELGNLPPDISAINAKIFNTDKLTLFSCGLKISRLYRVYDLGRKENKDGFNNKLLLDGVSSCCSIFKRGVLNSIKNKWGYFDKRFFFLFEDVDLSIRVKNKEGKFIFIPNLVCFHDSQQAGISEDYRRFLCLRNRWYIILKNKAGFGLVFFVFQTFFYDFIRIIHFAFTNRFFMKFIRDIYIFVCRK